MHAPSTRCSCGSQSLRRGGWPCSSRIAFRRCGWRTGSWCSRAASWWTRGRTRNWWRGVGCTPSCSASRRRAIGDPDEHVTQVAVATPRRARRLAAEIAFVVQAARPGFWLTSIWFYLVPVGGRNVLAHGEFWLGLFYVSFPLGVLLYGWNDVVDFEADRFNPRKGTYLFGARGTPERLARLPWVIALVQVPFAILFTLLLGPKALVWFVVAFLAAEAALIWTWAGDPWLAAFLAASAVWFTLDVTLLWRDRPYSPGEMRLLFLAWNAVALASMPWIWHVASLAPR